MDPAMEDAPILPREARFRALLVMAETVVAQTDAEKGSWEWKGRSEIVEAIALLASVILGGLSPPNSSSPGLHRGSLISALVPTERINIVQAGGTAPTLKRYPIDGNCSCILLSVRNLFFTSLHLITVVR